MGEGGRMRTLTINQIMKRVARGIAQGGNIDESYTRDRAIQLFAGRGTITALDILNADISVGEKFWLVLRPELMSEELLYIFACDCAEHVLPIAKKIYSNDKWRWIQRWIHGNVVDEELNAARNAIGRAAGYARERATASKARNAARYSAKSEAASKTRDSASYAANMSAEYAIIFATRARHIDAGAERQWQLDRLRSLFR